MLSALVHPWFYVLAAADLWSGRLWHPPEAGIGVALWWLAALNLLAGYVAAIALGVAAVARRGRLDLARHAALMPVYWLAISFAAYRALLQLVRAPHYWEKTEHRPRKTNGNG